VAAAAAEREADSLIANVFDVRRDELLGRLGLLSSRLLKARRRELRSTRTHPNPTTHAAGGETAALVRRTHPNPTTHACVPETAALVRRTHANPTTHACVPETAALVRRTHPNPTTHACVPETAALVRRTHAGETAALVHRTHACVHLPPTPPTAQSGQPPNRLSTNLMLDVISRR
jgi:hypothetical protein